MSKRLLILYKSDNLSVKTWFPYPIHKCKLYQCFPGAIWFSISLFGLVPYAVAHLKLLKILVFFFYILPVYFLSSFLSDFGGEFSEPQRHPLIKLRNTTQWRPKNDSLKSSHINANVVNHKILKLILSYWEYQNFLWNVFFNSIDGNLLSIGYTTKFSRFAFHTLFSVVIASFSDAAENVLLSISYWWLHVWWWQFKMLVAESLIWWLVQCKNC